MIRRATLDDMELAVELGRDMFGKSHWNDLTTYDAGLVRATLERLIEQDDAAVFVSDRGILILIVVPLWFSGLPTVHELFFWALDGSGDALRRAGEAWAREVGAVVPVIMGAHEPGDMDRLDCWYRRAGYVPHGRTYRKVLN